MPAHLVEIGRNGAQRLIEAERHVPGLGGKDREDRGAFRPQLASREEPHEEHDREGEKAEHRHRLQDVERRNMMTSSALRLFAASVATTKVNRSEAKIAANMRIVVRSAYSGRLRGSSVTGAMSRVDNGAFISWAPCTTATRTPTSRTKTMAS